MRKTKKIIIILIIIVFILLCGTFAFAYLGTDIFKSNKYLFNKYAAQVNLNEFLDLNDYEEFTSRIINESHTNNGNLSITAKIQELGDFNEKFTFKTNTNVEDNKASGEIMFSQDGEKKLGLEYLKNGDLYGLKCIYKQYMALENNNLKQFFSKLGMDTEDMPDKIDFNLEQKKPDEKAEQLVDDMKLVLNKYVKLAIDEIPDKNYEKIKKETIEVEGQTIEADGYKITLTESELINIIKKLVNNAKNDQDMLDLLNTALEISGKSKYNVSEYQDILEQLEDGLDDSNADYNNKITIYMYKQGKKLVKAYMKVTTAEENDYMDFAIDNNRTIKINYEQNSKDSYSYFDVDSYSYSDVDSYSYSDDYSNDREVKKESTSLIIAKDTTDGENKYNITIVNAADDDTKEINLSFSLKNMEAESYQTRLTANFDLSSQYDYKINIDYSNITTFSDDIQIPEFEEGNYVILNDVSEEQLSNLAKDLGEKINERVNVEKIYIPFISESYMLYTGLLDKTKSASEQTKEEQYREAITLAKAEILTDYYSGNTQEVTEEEVKEMVEKYLDDEISINVRKEIEEYKFTINAEGKNYILDLTSIGGQLETRQQTTFESISNEADNQAVQIFNAKFEAYGGQVSAATAKQVLSMMEYSTSSNHVIQANCTIADIDSSKKYNISFEKDDEGYINKILIDEL